MGGKRKAEDELHRDESRPSRRRQTTDTPQELPTQNTNPFAAINITSRSKIIPIPPTDRATTTADSATTAAPASTTPVRSVDRTATMEEYDTMEANYHLENFAQMQAHPHRNWIAQIENFFRVEEVYWNYAKLQLPRNRQMKDPARPVSLPPPLRVELSVTNQTKSSNTAPEKVQPPAPPPVASAVAPANPFVFGGTPASTTASSSIFGGTSAFAPANVGVTFGNTKVSLPPPSPQQQQQQQQQSGGVGDAEDEDGQPPDLQTQATKVVDEGYTEVLEVARVVIYRGVDKKKYCTGLLRVQSSTSTSKHHHIRLVVRDPPTGKVNLNVVVPGPFQFRKDSKDQFGYVMSMTRFDSEGDQTEMLMIKTNVGLAKNLFETLQSLTNTSEA